jgi:hypothetical protein
MTLATSLGTFRLLYLLPIAPLVDNGAISGPNTATNSNAYTTSNATSNPITDANSNTV